MESESKAIVCLFKKKRKEEWESLLEQKTG